MEMAVVRTDVRVQNYKAAAPPLNCEMALGGMRTRSGSRQGWLCICVVRAASLAPVIDLPQDPHHYTRQSC